MTIGIVTDSTCDLPADTAQRLGVAIVPCYINIGEASYLDGISLTRQAFYENLTVFPKLPKTSAPGIGLFTETYRRLADEGISQVISMHIHSGLSNLSNAARQAAGMMQGIKVNVIEIGQLALGLGFMVMTAAEAALEGNPEAEIIRRIRKQEKNTFVYAALDTLDYLRESGRAPGLLTNIASLLHIKPIIQLHQGRLRLAGQTRTITTSIDWLISGIQKLGNLGQIAVLHTHALEKAELLRSRIREAFPEFPEIMISEVTPVLGVHIGPGAVGLVCVKSG